MADPHSSNSPDNPTLAKNRTVDAVVSVVLMLIGAVVIMEARRLGAEWTSDGPGSGYFPLYIGIIIEVSGLGIFYQAVFGNAPDHGPFVDREQAQRVLSVLLPAALYALVTHFLGLYLASAIYIALFMVILGKYPAGKSVFLAVIVNTLFFLMFEVWFKVPLFKGTLEPLAFLGY